MKNYLHTKAIDQPESWVQQAISVKKDPWAQASLGKGKVLCLLFFNNSLRTRLSTQRAAIQLGMEVIVMNFGSEGWQLELEDGVVMDQGKAEHVREAAQVIAQYADVVGIRAFAQLQDAEADNKEAIITAFAQYAGIPVINLESSVGHPLQALADAITITENKQATRPKVVLSWAPHPRPLPHAVANSFLQIMQRMEVDLVLTHPKGYELDPRQVGPLNPVYNQEEALKQADFVYVKNWSSYSQYGKVLNTDRNWMMTSQKLGQAKFMHCLPLRRNVVAEDAVLDGPNSLVIEQANNRTYAAQLVLQKILEQL